MTDWITQLGVGVESGSRGSESGVGFQIVTHRPIDGGTDDFGNSAYGHIFDAPAIKMKLVSPGTPSVVSNAKARNIFNPLQYERRAPIVYWANVL